jgi:hypothetical protein
MLLLLILFVFIRNCLSYENITIFNGTLYPNTIKYINYDIELENCKYYLTVHSNCTKYNNQYIGLCKDINHNETHFILSLSSPKILDNCEFTYTLIINKNDESYNMNEEFPVYIIWIILGIMLICIIIIILTMCTSIGCTSCFSGNEF